MADKLSLTQLPGSQWYAEELAGGRFYFNGDTDAHAKEAVDLARGLALGDISLGSLDLVSDRGMTANVYGSNDTVVKVFDQLMFGQQNPLHPRSSGLPYLQASVALHEGLAHQAPMQTYREGDVRFKFSSPKMFALFRPHSTKGDRYPISVMARAPGVGREEFGDLPVPSLALRGQAYVHAIQAAGLPGHRIMIDEIGDNTHLQRVDEETVEVTRLDILGVGRQVWKLGLLTGKERAARMLSRAVGAVFQY